MGTLLIGSACLLDSDPLPGSSGVLSPDGVGLAMPALAHSSSRINNREQSSAQAKTGYTTANLPTNGRPATLCTTTSCASLVSSSSSAPALAAWSVLPL